MFDAFQRFTDAASRAYGAVDKSIGGILPGGAERSDTVKKIMAAPEAVAIVATEAVPAIAGGFVGKDRTDTSINPKMKSAIIDAEKKASAAGKDLVDYSDYDSTTPGGLAARLTMGRIGMNEFKRDDEGNATGFTQKFDTDKNPIPAASEFNRLNPKTYYKPMEAALAVSQNFGLTTHDIDFKNTISEPQSRPTPPTSPTESDAMKAYNVAVGDTLTSIAAKHGLSIDEIARKNNIDNINMISIGQQLKL